MINLNTKNKDSMVVGFVGFIGAGKDTAADYLVNTHGYRRDSFASTLKDAIACVFGWDRNLLDGRTSAARAWREQRDDWWSTRLSQPITPRWVLQYWGTDALRMHFHDDIWIASLENKMRKATDNIVISDVRFPNEIASIHNSGGIVVRVKRGTDPEWYDDALAFNQSLPGSPLFLSSKLKMETSKIHVSEYSWVGSNIDYTIYNDTTTDALFKQIESLINNKR